MDLIEYLKATETDCAELRMWSEMYHDLQKQRIAQSNRSRSATVERSIVDATLAPMKQAEDLVATHLRLAYRRAMPSGVIEWQKATPGIGEFALARLIGHLGHPRIAWPGRWVKGGPEDEQGNAPRRTLVRDEPYLRTVDQLWQYCGVGAPMHRVKDMTQEELFALGKPTLKMVLHLLVTGIVKAQVRAGCEGHAFRTSKAADGRCVICGGERSDERMAGGELGQLYLDTKARYSKAAHSGPCPGGFTSAGPGKTVRSKCKARDEKGALVRDEKGKVVYADVGDPFQPSHVEAIAKRRVAKEILVQLYDAAAIDGILSIPEVAA